PGRASGSCSSRTRARTGRAASSRACRSRATPRSSPTTRTSRRAGPTSSRAASRRTPRTTLPTARADGEQPPPVDPRSSARGAALVRRAAGLGPVARPALRGAEDLLERAVDVGLLGARGRAPPLVARGVVEVGRVRQEVGRSEERRVGRGGSSGVAGGYAVAAAR